tara:strand:- start:5398 stop:6549 length:1152 start_codon:yes stop_codon:yes gene_type:complete
MRALFIIQGEGRGHMTQALALSQILTEAGHEVTSMIIGTNKRREVPAYFKQKSNAKVHTVVSPNFFYDKGKKSINLWKTGVVNGLNIPQFIGQLRKIKRVVKNEQPDVIINFYDILAGMYFGIYKPKVKRICIGHQYLAEDSSFPFAEGYPLQKRCFQLTNKLTSLNADMKIALSFRDIKPDSETLTIAPPLLREEIFNLVPSKGDYILAYVVNPGYAYDLMEWHKHNKKIRLHCFWDNLEQEDEWTPWKNITFHHINDQKFLSYMKDCIGYVSTAGFESICEAMYLGKPVMMVPVEKQYEQACNSLDAVKAGAGITNHQFVLDPFLKYLSTHETETKEFKQWMGLNKTIILEAIEEPVTPNRSPIFNFTPTIPKLFSISTNN